ncbi:putative nucleotidyltransferase with HDIG domain [Desulfomicrobium macestii]|uniref:HDIG domain-containing protein n=2 Tax=Desulfomicrobium TaxID=898 RepID=A0A8G2C215_DESNO|nr:MULTISPECIES: HDOD domain-containing protein [Desulfomicrobium]MBE1425669.1 putative nucleotidyltransferase with HDIG domain [Desulfomicrobium macestii]SFL57661.1 HDIG domain-containing protein [Desulfomicrobium norvegicum]
MNEAKSFIEILMEHVNSDKAQLPPFNRTGLAIQQEMAKPDPDMQVIEKQILRDPAVAGQLLKVANSSFYRGMIEVTTVRNAMVRLGLAEVSNLVTLLTQKQSFSTQDSFIREYMDQLWIHSVACALGAKWIAKECRLPSKMNEAFFAGLLHDIGKAFLLMAISDLKKNGQMGDTIPQSFIEEVLETQHQSIGAQLLKTWNLPEIYCTVAEHHHDENMDGQDIVLIMVSLANKVLAKAGIGIMHTPDIDLATSPEAIQLDLSEIKVAELELTMEDYVDFVGEVG